MSGTQVTIFNDTQYTFELSDGTVWPRPEVSRWLGTINSVGQKGSAFVYEFFEDTVRDWHLFLYKDKTSSEPELVIPAQDNEDAREIRVYETSSNEIRHWISVPRDPSKELPSNTPVVQDLASFETMKEEISTRMDGSKVLHEFGGACEKSKDMSCPMRTSRANVLEGNTGYDRNLLTGFQRSLPSVDSV
ncbi:hypothetical protein M758_5G136500 [Ceratodon purpureus]|nr:hypothetical protein M758_5G136500 [Ceratodon purpureus]